MTSPRHLSIAADPSGEIDQVFSSVCHGYDRRDPLMAEVQRVAGLPMLSHADCRLLEGMVLERMRHAEGDALYRLTRWHHAIAHTRNRATRENWPGWEQP